MARYEYRCKVCDDRFEVRRPMSEADASTTCPSGHREVARLLSVFASVGGAGSAAVTPTAPGRAAGGGGRLRLLARLRTVQHSVSQMPRDAVFLRRS